MLKPERSMYPFTWITEAFKHVVNTKQKDNNSLLDNSKRLKQAKYIMKAHVGKYILVHYVETIKDFNNTTGVEDKKRVKSEVINKWIPYLLIANPEQ